MNPSCQALAPVAAAPQREKYHPSLEKSEIPFIKVKEIINTFIAITNIHHTSNIELRYRGVHLPNLLRFNIKKTDYSTKKTITNSILIRPFFLQSLLKTALKKDKGISTKFTSLPPEKQSECRSAVKTAYKILSNDGYSKLIKLIDPKGHFFLQIIIDGREKVIRDIFSDSFNWKPYNPQLPVSAAAADDEEKQQDM